MTMGEVYGLCLLLWLFSYFIIWIISWIGLSSFFSSLCSWLGWSVLTLFLWAYDKDSCEVWGAGLGWWRKLVLTDCGPSTYWVAVGDMRLVAHRTINKQCLEYFINILMLRMQIIIIIEDAWNWFVHSYTNILSTEVLSNVYFFWGRERGCFFSLKTCRTIQGKLFSFSHLGPEVVLETSLCILLGAYILLKDLGKGNLF